jgi:hypothetical protein
MPLSLPISASTGTVYYYGSKAWTFDGVKWIPSGGSQAVTSVSTVAPIATAGRLWYDINTGTNQLKVYDGTSWVAVGFDSRRAGYNLIFGD